MNKSVLAGLIILVLLASGVAFALTRPKSQPANNTTPTTSTPAASNMSDMSNMTNETTATNQSSSDTQSTNNVVMKNTAFSPTSIKVKVGDTVTWTNQDAVQHDVAPDKDYGDDFKGSELLSKGQTYSFTFKKAGTYTYHCTPHPFMKATVVVE